MKKSVERGFYQRVGERFSSIHLMEERTEYDTFDPPLGVPNP